MCAYCHYHVNNTCVERIFEYKNSQSAIRARKFHHVLSIEQLPNSCALTCSDVPLIPQALEMPEWLDPSNRRSRHSFLPSVREGAIQAGLSWMESLSNVYDGDPAKMTTSFVSNYVKLTENDDHMMKLFEDCMILMHNLIYAHDKAAIAIAVITFCKLRGIRISVKTLIMSAITTFATSFIGSGRLEPQADTGDSMDKALEMLAESRKMLKDYDAFKNSQLCTRLYKLGMYVMTLTLASKIGSNFKEAGYTKLEEEAMRREYHLGPDFIFCMLDTLTFVATVGLQCIKIGSIEPILHTIEHHEAWYESAMKLKRDYVLMSNPEPHGLDRYSFLADLKDAIEKGRSIRKFSCAAGPSEKRIIMSTLNDLEIIHSDMTTKRAACMGRRPPFGFLLYGGTSVAKSALTEILYHHYGQIFRLNTGPEFKYTRNPIDPFWSNFNSTQWCINFDDVGFQHPNVSTVDQSLSETIQVINSTNFVPTQADLADKGRTPMLAKLVLASTNTLHLNTHCKFSFPIAVNRRYPFVAHVRVKTKYAKEGGMIDTSKLPATMPGEYPDFWDITLLKCEPGSQNRAKFVPIDTYTNIYDFVDKFSELAMAHESTQIKAETAHAAFTQVTTCEECKRVTKLCICNRIALEAADMSMAQRLDALLSDNTRPNYSAVQTSRMDLRQRFGRTLDDVLEPQMDLSGNNDSDTDGEDDLVLDDSVPSVEHITVDTSIFGILEPYKFFKGFSDSIPTKNDIKIKIGYCGDCICLREHWCPLVDKWIDFHDFIRDHSPEAIVASESHYSRFIISCIVYFSSVWWISFICGFLYGPFWKIKLGRRFLGDAKCAQLLMKHASNSIRTTLDLPFVLTTITATLIVVWGSYGILKQLLPAKEVQSSVEKPELKEPINAVEAALKGDVLQDDDKPSKTFYFHDQYRVSNLDLSQQVLTTSYEQLMKRVNNNLARIVCFEEKDSGVTRTARSGTMFGVKGNVWVVNTHTLPKKDTFYIKIINEQRDTGITSNIREMLINSGDLYHMPERDLTFITIRNLPPVYDISPYFPGPKLQGIFEGIYPVLDKTGVKNIRKLTNVHRKELSEYINYKGTSFDLNSVVWTGLANEATVSGHCGSPMVVESRAGPIILGIHALASNKNVYALAITQKDIDELSLHLKYFKISKGTVKLSTQSVKVESTTDLPPKSHINYVESGNARVMGAIAGWRAHSKSSVVPTLIAPSLRRRGYMDVYGPPIMDWRPKMKALSELTKPTFLMDSRTLGRASSRYMLKILRNIQYSEIRKMRVLTNCAAMNGIAGVKYCDKINRNTSAGFPYNKSKRYFIDQVPSAPGTDLYDAVPEIWEQVEDYVKNSLKGVRSHPIYNACLKDEVKSKKHIDAAKTRVFSIANFSMSLMMRKFLLPCVILMQNNKYVFENAPGMVAQSPEWKELFDRITRHGRKRMIAGDYKLFDKTMLAMVIQEAFRVIYNLCKIAGYTNDQLQVIEAIIQDVSFPTTNFFNDIIEFLGSNPSGHPLTVIINGVGNCLYARYAYDILERKEGGDSCPKLSMDQITNLYMRDRNNTFFSQADGFEEHIEFMAYGDDNIIGVSEDCLFFNHTTMQNVLAEVGITYTMADKDSISVPFVNIDQISFLKRGFRYDKDIGCVVAPLEEASITKRLLACVASKTISPRAQSYINLMSALEEWFFYGKETFLEKLVMINEIILENDLVAFTITHPLPSYENLKDRFWDSTLWGSETTIALSDLEVQYQQQINLGCGLTNPLTLNQVSKTSNEEMHCELHQGCVQKPNSAPCGQGVPVHYTPQADVVGSDELTQVTNTTQEIVGFLDSNEVSKSGMASISDSTALQDTTQDCGLGEFLSRPVQIYQYTWNESDAVGLDVTFNPWSLFFNNVIIQRKLTNYAFLRCDLKLKIMMNASPFYYGVKMFSYQPLTAFSNTTISSDANLGQLIPYSQRPHVWLYAQNNEGAEMMLPFFYHQQWLPTVDAFQFANMGQITALNYSTLQSANGVTGSGIPITVYAWAENVQLSGPTIGLVLQSDEYSDKPISSTASAVAAAAGKLTKVPGIGPFMTATQMGAGTLASIAAKFGFSNPPVIDNYEPIVTNAYPNLPTTEIRFPVQKLTLDPKNEVTVDPRVTGLTPIDELGIEHLIGKESFLISTTWNSSDAPDKILFNSGVSPNLYSVAPAVAGCNTIQMPPMAWVAQLFRYWRGDVIFRFRPICSQFHRGRLRIIWDPAGGTSQNIANTSATQAACFNEIIDLSKDTNVEIRVPYNQALAWSQNFTSVNQNYSSSSSTANFYHTPGYTNGSIVLKVVNTLTSPVLATNIPILISVRAAENMIFSAPVDINSRQLYPFVPQSDEYEVTPCEHIIPGNSPGGMDDKIFLVNMGEKIVTLRQLLRRASYSFGDPSGGAATGALLSTRQTYNRMPPPPGFDPNGRYLAKKLSDGTTTVPYCWSALHPITWVSSAFVGYRGSINWTCATIGGASNTPTQITTSRSEIGVASVANFNFSPGGLTGSGCAKRLLYGVCNVAYGMANGLVGGSQAGMAITSTNTNNGLTINSGWYSQFKFNSTDNKWNSGLSGTPPDDSDKGFLATTSSRLCSTITDTSVVTHYAAIGTDWGPVFFLNVPTSFYYPALPVAV